MLKVFNNSFYSEYEVKKGNAAWGEKIKYNFIFFCKKGLKELEGLDGWRGYYLKFQVPGFK